MALFEEEVVYREGYRVGVRYCDEVIFTTERIAIPPCPYLEESSLRKYWLEGFEDGKAAVARVFD